MGSFHPPLKWWAIVGCPSRDESSIAQLQNARPRVITNNGPQLIARDFKQFIHICGITHVRISPYYRQSNGKLERYHKTIKSRGIRPRTPLSLEQAHTAVTEFVHDYNTRRLHSAISDVTPLDKLEGR